MENQQKIQEYTLQLLEEKEILFSSFEAFRKFIIEKINYWILNDFDHLMFILYRIDVHEDKVRRLLKEHQNENAAEIIADLIIERQHQKIESRKLFRFTTENVDEDELW